MSEGADLVVIESRDEQVREEQHEEFNSFTEIIFHVSMGQNNRSRQAEIHLCFVKSTQKCTHGAPWWRSG